MGDSEERQAEESQDGASVIRKLILIKLAVVLVVAIISVILIRTI